MGFAGKGSRRRSRVNPRNVSMRRTQETAVAMKYQMWLLPTSEFLRLSEFKPHEELLAEGKLVRVDPSMQNIFYLSHEWTSLRQPDHSMAQLYTFQTMLLRMLNGDLPETAPTFADAVRLPPNVKITSSQWKGVVQDSFIFMDFFSVRQRLSLTRIWG